MPDIKDMLLADETLFKSQEVFDPNYMPEEFSFRDSQIKELTYCLKPGMRNSRPLNSFIFGNPATGKTTAVRILFDELQKTTDKIIPVHINCQIYPTHYKIASEIHRKLFGFVPPETGVPLTRLYDKIFDKVRKDKKILVVALDDINHLFLSGQANDVLYSILRAYETYADVKTAVWAISTDNCLYKIENKVRSIFHPQEVMFHDYKKDEINEILQRRADVGFYPDVLNKKLLMRVVDACIDVRHGIELMKHAATFAEANASKKITDEHIEKAMKNMPSGVQTVNSDESILIDLIKKHTPIESGVLFEKLEEHTDFSYTKFYRLLQKLKARNLIQIEAIKKRRGKSSVIRVK
jgi:cell division control protein 6